MIYYKIDLVIPRNVLVIWSIRWNCTVGYLEKLQQIADGIAFFNKVYLFQTFLEFLSWYFNRLLLSPNSWEIFLMMWLKSWKANSVKQSVLKSHRLWLAWCWGEGSQRGAISKGGAVSRDCHVSIVSDLEISGMKWGNLHKFLKFT